MDIMIDKSSLITKMPEYKNYLINCELKESTICKYIADANQFLASCSEEISQERLFDYKKRIISKYKIATVNAKLISINKFIEWCGYKDMRVRIVKVQNIQSVDNVLTKQEYERMLNGALNMKKWKMYYIMRILAMTGIRVGELKFFTVEAIEMGKIEIFNKDKVRVIYLGERVCKLLFEYCEKNKIINGTIFLGRDSKPISTKTIWKNIKTIAEHEGITKEKAYPHSFRHLFAKEYISVSGDITELADILGHSKIETTWKYTRTSVREKRMVLDKLDF